MHRQYRSVPGPRVISTRPIFVFRVDGGTVARDFSDSRAASQPERRAGCNQSRRGSRGSYLRATRGKIFILRLISVPSARRDHDRDLRTRRSRAPKIVHNSRRNVPLNRLVAEPLFSEEQQIGAQQGPRNRFKKKKRRRKTGN